MKNSAAEKLTGVRVLSNVDIAILKPAPSPTSTFSLGILTSSNVIPRVSEQR